MTFRIICMGIGHTPESQAIAERVAEELQFAAGTYTDFHGDTPLDLCQRIQQQDGPIELYAHSRGVSVARQALEHLPTDHRPKLSCFAFEGVELVPGHLAGRVVNYVNLTQASDPYQDLVTWMALLADRWEGFDKLTNLFLHRVHPPNRLAVITDMMTIVVQDFPPIYDFANALAIMTPLTPQQLDRRWRHAICASNSAIRTRFSNGSPRQVQA